MPKQKVVLIKNGIAKGIVYDSHTAAKDGKESTGHATHPSSIYGPMPGHVCMAAGDKSVEEMIASTERGILVTRFHYNNVISPKETILTGMTRDGTFLVEGGKIKHAVQKLRFTESVLKMLRNVEMLGAEQKLSAGCLTPALKAANFNFSS